MTVSEPVSYVQAKIRALGYLRDQPGLAKASCVGGAVWPGSELRTQGLGGAASRILKRMKDENLVVWDSGHKDWGWKLTSAGRKAAVEAGR